MHQLNICFSKQLFTQSLILHQNYSSQCQLKNDPNVLTRNVSISAMHRSKLPSRVHCSYRKNVRVLIPKRIQNCEISLNRVFRVS